MGDVKSRLQQLRQRGPAAPNPQPAAAPDTPAVSARAARFAAPDDEIHDLDEESAPGQAAAEGLPDNAEPAPPPPQARSSRAERFGAPAPRPAAPAAQPASLRDWRRGRAEAPPAESDDGCEASTVEVSTAPPPAEPWTDPSRPAGSAYSAEEWDAAQAANPDCILVEIHKPQEKGLLAIGRSTLDAMRQTFLHRTLLVDERVAAGHAYPDQVCGRVEHRAESFGLFRYRLVRAACQDEVAAKHGYYGAVLRNWEYEPDSGRRSPALEEARSERAQRFAERSRG